MSNCSHFLLFEQENPPTNMINPKLSIQIVAYNDMEDLKDCLDSLYQQNYKDFSITVVDNNSSDGTVDQLKKNYPSIRLIANHQNLGFAQAHNQAIEQTSTPYILVLNPDTIFEPSFLMSLMAVMEEDASLGSVSGKMLKLADLSDRKRTDIIDTTGIILFKNRKAIDRGQGEQDVGQYDNQQDILGPSGAAALYSRKALETVKWQGGYFDQDFFAYKEDIDIAWRLRLFGWKSKFVPQAIGYHKRKVGLDTSSVRKTRRQRNPQFNYFSYRNHLYLVYKNETSSNLFWWFPYIFWYEFKKFFYLLLFEPFTLKGLKDFFDNYSDLSRKRKYIQSNIKVDKKNIRSWFQ